MTLFSKMQEAEMANSYFIIWTDFVIVPFQKIADNDSFRQLELESKSWINMSNLECPVSKIDRRPISFYGIRLCPP
jgi:hypothetical protein